MGKEKLMKRITMDPKIMVGEPVIRGTRITVQHIVGLLASGMTEEQILSEYDGLTEHDIRACLLFAAEALGDSASRPYKAPIHVAITATSTGFNGSFMELRLCP